MPVLRLVGLPWCLLVALGASSVGGADVVMIEEHWELHVGGPEEARSAPQVTMIMSPSDTIDEEYFAFTVNHWSHPYFQPGGYQLQRWHGDECLDVNHGYKTTTIHTDGEIISWTQRLSIDDGRLRFQVVDGSSQSWGSFGGEGFDISTPTELARLNTYRPAISVEQSGIGYAGNRVSSLILQRLRWVTDDGEEHSLVAPIDIATDLDP